jgi:hypothetical protein
MKMPPDGAADTAARLLTAGGAVILQAILPVGPISTMRPGRLRVRCNPRRDPGSLPLQSLCHGGADDGARPVRKGERHDNDRAGAGVAALALAVLVALPPAWVPPVLGRQA